MFKRAFALGLWCALALPTTVLAADTGEQVGKNLGNMIGGWAKSLYIGIAGIVAIVFLFNRKFTELALFCVAAIIVGGFVLAPDSVAEMVKGFWSSLTKGT